MSDLADNRTLRKVVERALDGSAASVGAVDQVVSEINDSLWLAQQRIAVAEEIALAIEDLDLEPGQHDEFYPGIFAAAARARKVGAAAATR